MKHYVMMAVLAVVMASCSTPQDITYMQNVESLPADVLKATAKTNTPVIMPGDLLQINVTASNPELVKFFNKTEMVTTGNTNSNNSENAMYYYLVDNDGMIMFPMLGQIKVGGKTQSAVEADICNRIHPRYLAEKPGVEVRFQNFHVYTMGEVGRPGHTLWAELSPEAFSSIGTASAGVSDFLRERDFFGVSTLWFSVSLALSATSLLSLAGLASFLGRPLFLVVFSCEVFRDSACACVSRIAKARDSLSIFFAPLMFNSFARFSSCSLLILLSS